jgi:hypothetical protein
MRERVREGGEKGDDRFEARNIRGLDGCTRGVSPPKCTVLAMVKE